MATRHEARTRGSDQGASTPMYVDASCYHATFATVLRWHGCPDPRFVLGNSVSTNATLDPAGLHFQDSYASLAATCDCRGYDVRRRLASSPGAWAETTRRLHLGLPVIGFVDPFHLPYYWIDYQRTHSQHALILWSFDTAEQRLRISDPMEILRYEATVPLGDVSDSWTADDRGQAWIDIAPRPDWDQPDRSTVRAEVRSHARALVESRSHLSCTQMARHIIVEFDAYLELTLRLGEPNPLLGTDQRRQQSSRFLRGIWNFHHTMRWFALYLRATLHDGTSPSVDTPAVVELDAALLAADEIAQNWLVVRNLLIKHAMSKAIGRPRLAKYCVQRIEQIVVRTEELVHRLEALADIMPDTIGASGR